MTISRRARSAAVVAVAVTAALVWGAPPAQARTGVLESVVQTPGQLEISLSASGVSGRDVDVTLLEVLADSRALEASARLVSPEDKTPATVDRSVVLVIDTSGSMKGDRLAGAKKAAREYVAAVPDDVRLGLVTFDDDANTAVGPTLQHDVVSDAVGRLAAKGGTSLYDGVLAGVKALGTSGDRQLLLLSDGADADSKASLATAASRVDTSNVSLSAVRLGTDAGADKALKKLATAGSGRVVAVNDARGLAAALERAAPVDVVRIAITATVPSELAGRDVALEVSVGEGAGLVTAARSVQLAGRTKTAEAAPPAAEAPAPVAASRTTAALGAAAFGLGVLLFAGLLLGLTSGRAKDANRTKKLLDNYTLHPTRGAEPEPQGSALARSQVTRSAVDLADRFARRRGLEERLALSLDRASVAMRPAEWLLLKAALGVVTAVLLLLVTGKPLAALGIGLAAGMLLPRVYLRVKTRRRQADFAAQLPDALQLIAGSLSAGYSLPQALDAVVREGTQPMAGEIGRALAESRLGVPVEEALDTVATRMDLIDFRWVVMAIRVQREVGGNLSGVLTTVAATMRDRARLRRTIRALSAEGKLSAYILVGLPIGVSAFMLAFRREYMEPLYTEALGIAMLVSAVLLLIAGAFWMRNLVKVEA